MYICPILYHPLAVHTFFLPLYDAEVLVEYGDVGYNLYIPPGEKWSYNSFCSKSWESISMKDTSYISHFDCHCDFICLLPSWDSLGITPHRFKLYLSWPLILAIICVFRDANLGCWCYRKWIMDENAIIATRSTSTLQRDLYAIGGVFKKQPQGSIIIGFWNIHWSVHQLFHLEHTVGISTCSKPAC